MTEKTKIIDLENLNFEAIRSTMNTLFCSDFKEFWKAVISIETGILDEEQLEEIFDSWYQMDGVGTIFCDSIYEMTEIVNN